MDHGHVQSKQSLDAFVEDLRRVLYLFKASPHRGSPTLERVISHLINASKTAQCNSIVANDYPRVRMQTVPVPGERKGSG